jgi:predicted kinase
VTEGASTWTVFDGSMHQPTQRRQDVIPAGRLIVISGRPGTGKTTLAKATAQELPACYLRVDAAETALVRAGVAVVTEGYAVIHELAVSNLQLGHTVVVDAVNPVPQARAGWFETAARAQARLVMVELELPDLREHRRRVEERDADIPGHVLPTWDQVVHGQWTPWNEERDGEHLRIDSTNADVALAHLLQALRPE